MSRRFLPASDGSVRGDGASARRGNPVGRLRLDFARRQPRDRRQLQGGRRRKRPASTSTWSTTAPPCYVSAREGAAATAAGKGLSSNELSAGKVRYLVAALNQNVIGDGVLVLLSVQVKNNASGSYTLKLTNVAGIGQERQDHRGDGRRTAR